jgi:hypothetical protein
MPVSEVTAAGTDWGVQVLPPFVVAMIAGPGGPEDDKPVAMQWSESEHAIPLKVEMVAGIDSMDQVAPPSVVPMMLGAPVFGSKSLTA